jgi:two-component system, OmpR family, response regulator
VTISYCPVITYVVFQDNYCYKSLLRRENCSIHFFNLFPSATFKPVLLCVLRTLGMVVGDHVIDTSGLPRILCVDDNPDVADSTADLLGIFGYETRACYDGPSALATAETFAPHICLIDLNMPGMDGDVLAVRLRQSGRPLLLVVVTAMNNEESCLRIAAAGFDLHLIKPVDPSRLQAAIGLLWRAPPTTP